MALRGRGKLEDKDAAAGRRYHVLGALAVLFAGVWCEVTVAGDHDEVEIGLVERLLAADPAEVDEF